MLHHEKKAFWKFFTIYFGSVALLILASGYFYFTQQKKELIEKEHFSMIEYIRKVKMKEVPPENSGISYEIKDIVIPNFSMENFKIEENKFSKYMPYSWESGYILVKKDKSQYYGNVFKIKLYIIATQLFLLTLFATLSYFLSMAALKPMQEAIRKLDNFSKDLIHDLNTPITSILLNMKLLDKNDELKNNKPLSRIKRSVEDISELHVNLTTLLQEETMIMVEEDLAKIVEDVILTHKRIYPDVNFEVNITNFKATINRNAFNQVMVNLISNACKYNKNKGVVKVYSENKTLYIQDSGVGIKNPSEIFERAYKEHKSGYGIGLDIVKRLCDAMSIKIFVISEVGVSSTFILKLN